MYEKEFDLAVRAADVAGKHLLKHCQPRVDSQKGKDIKLSADRESENIIIKMLSETGWPILSEERGLVDAPEYLGDLRWIIDPLDGTANYWRGLKELACVAVALWEGERPVLGVVNRFSQGELYAGMVGAGAWLNGSPIHTSDTTRLEDSFLATGFPVNRDYGKESLATFIRQVQTCKKIRMLGTASIMGAFVAAGKLDIYAEEQIMLWDVAASAALVKAAGGVIDVQRLANHRCICRLFANESLQQAMGEISLSEGI